MKYTLFGKIGNSKTEKVRIVANLLNVDIDFKCLENKDLKQKEFLAKSPLGKVPVLEYDGTFVFQSNAIMRHFARLVNIVPLYGTNPIQCAHVDQWLDFVTQEVEPPLTALLLPIFGQLEYIEERNKRAQADLNTAFKVLDQNLKQNTYLCGDQITLADISLATELARPYQFLFNEAFRKANPHVDRWFKQVRSGIWKPFNAILGKQHYGTFPIPEASKPKHQQQHIAEEQKAQTQAKKPAEQQKKPAEQQKKPAAEEDDGEEKPEPKKSNPLDKLPPSTFNLFDFKTLFVNEPNKKVACDFLWKHFDPKGYSLWFLSYEKYQGEGEVVYKTKNLLQGYLQRLDHFRKYAIAVQGVYGDEPNLEIRGAWLIRGTEIPFEIKDHPQAEYNHFKKCDPSIEHDKTLFEEYWTGWEVDVSRVEGKTARFVTYFK